MRKVKSANTTKGKRTIQVKKVGDILPASTHKPYKRKPDGRFDKGTKGGPGGYRPNAGRVSKLSQQYHDRRLDKVLKNAWRFIQQALDPSVPPSEWLEGFDQRWKVIQYVIDRAHGKPRQTMSIQTDGFDTLDGAKVDLMVAAYLSAQSRKIVENISEKEQSRSIEFIDSDDSGPQESEPTDLPDQDFHPSRSG